MASITPFRDVIDAAARANGMTPDTVRLGCVTIACCFVAPLFRLLRSESSKHWVNIGLGIYAGWYVFEYAILHAICSATMVYLLLMALPRNLASKVVFIGLFAYLFCVHYYRQFHNPHLVWDAAEMILILKLIALASNYADATLPEDKKTAQTIKNQVKELPSLPQFFGFVFFFPTFLAGPVFEYSDYIYWMQQGRSAPWLVHLSNLWTIFVAGVGFACSTMLSVESIDSPDFFPESSWFMQRFWQCVAVMLYRFRFYIVWSIAEEAAALAGVGYVPSSGQWDGIKNNRMFLVELPTNFRVGINNWNMGVARWINAYVYQRMGLSKSGKPTALSTGSAFFFSALWHGLHPGYYIFFLFATIQIEVGKHIRRRYRSIFHYTEDRNAHPHAIFLSYFDGNHHPLAVLYDLGGLFLTWMSMQYVGVAFEILDLQRVVNVWKSWYFLPHIVTSLLFIFFIAVPPRKPRQRQDKNNTTSSDTISPTTTQKDKDL